MTSKSNKPKLTYVFHNPNTEEDIVKHITDVLAEVAVTKVQAAQAERFMESNSMKEVTTNQVAV